jgi:hypothetical protein
MTKSYFWVYISLLAATILVVVLWQRIVKKQKKWPVILCFAICGSIFASWTFEWGPQRPAFIQLLATPLGWFWKLFPVPNLDRPHIIFFIFSALVWFIYWTALGALIGFVLRKMFRFLRRQRKGADLVAESGAAAVEQPSGEKWDVLRFIYPIGFWGLLIYFTLEKQKLLPISLVLFWLFLIGVVAFFIFTFIRRFPPTKPYSAWCAVHAALETLPAALLFSPTVMNFYMFLYFAPATLAVLSFLFSNNFKSGGSLLWLSILITLCPVICFWFVLWSIRFIQHSWQLKRQTDSKVSNVVPILCIAAIGAVIFDVIGRIVYSSLFGNSGLGP